MILWLHCSGYLGVILVELIGIKHALHRPTGTAHRSTFPSYMNFDLFFIQTSGDISGKKLASIIFLHYYLAIRFSRLLWFHAFQPHPFLLQFIFYILYSYTIYKYCVFIVITNRGGCKPGKRRFIVCGIS